MSTSRNGRCVCGILVAHHFDHQNHKLSCEETARQHPHADVRRASLPQQFFRIVPKERSHGKA